MLLTKGLSTYFIVCKGLSNDMTSGFQGTPYFRRYDLELVSKQAISVKKSWGGGTVERLNSAYPMNNPMGKVHDEKRCKINVTKFRRFGVKEPRLSHFFFSRKVLSLLYHGSKLFTN